MTKFPKDTNLQIQEVRQTPSRINVKNMPENVIVKLLKTKDKEKSLKTFRG